MTTTPLSRDRVEAILGEVDDAVASRIIATRADEATLVKALHEVEQTVVLGEHADEPPSDPAYTQVRAVLVDLLVDDDLEYIDHATD
jgi:hypothetical protein